MRDHLTTLDDVDLEQITRILARIETLRTEDRSLDDITDALALEFPEPPGGGEWNVETLSTVLGVIDSVRTEQATPEAPEAAAATMPPAESTLFIRFDTSEDDTDPNLDLGTDVPTRTWLEDEGDNQIAVGPELDAWARPANGVDPVGNGPLVRIGLISAAVVLILAVVGFAGYRAGMVVEPTETAALTVPGDVQRSSSPSRPQTTDGSVDDVGDRSPGSADDPGAEGLFSLPPNGPGSALAFADGTVVVGGVFTSEGEADEFIANLSDVFGPENVVEGHAVDPAVAAPARPNVVFDRVELFKRGSAELRPDSIPLLETVSRVLQLNPHITLWVSALPGTAAAHELDPDIAESRFRAVNEHLIGTGVSADQLAGSWARADAGESADAGDGQQPQIELILKRAAVDPESDTNTDTNVEAG